MNDETVFVPRSGRSQPQPAAPVQEEPVRVDYPLPEGGTGRCQLTGPTVIGRSAECGIRISHELVSRQHVAVYPEGDQWWVRDLQSSNGTLVGGRPIERLPLSGVTTVELGKGGPQLRIHVPQALEPQAAPQMPDLDARMSAHYFDESRPGEVGAHTLFIRRAFRDARRRQRHLYLILLGMLSLVLVGLGGYVLHQRHQLHETARLANNIFYSMKEMELQIANLEAEIDADASSELRTRIAESKRRLAAMRRDYDDLVQKAQSARAIPLDSKEKLILHMARVFGETELDVPPDFSAEVEKYIRKWQSSDRMKNAIRRLHDNGYAPIIKRALEEQGLPPQFLYLAMQESNFRPQIVGPPTRYGHAKGMWQFIPATARRYGLKTGPLQQTGQYDPEDERHDVAKATRAAARYLKDIYRTDAQASGLLVMASYNWGEGNIIKRLRKMPENPRERNFWALLRSHKIPKETYDYVFYIFSAAVIGENPRLFGFDFDNPLTATP